MDEEDDTLYNVSTQNRFTGLQQQNNSAQATPPKQLYCPPIIIRGKSFKDVNDILKQNGIVSKFKLKLTSFGLRIQATDEEAHKKLLKTLAEANVEHFSYQLRSEIPLRFILSGLPTMDVNEIKNELVENNLPTIIDVTPLPIRTKRYDDHSIYIVRFPNKSINIHQLKQTKYLFNVVIKWDIYRRRKTGPVLCARCQHYGHVANNCKLNPRCSLCAGNHSYDNCPKKEETEIEPLCCNCNGNHKPISNACPKKSEYINIQMKLSKRQHLLHQNRQQNRFQIDNTLKQFPLLQQTRQQNTATSYSNPIGREPVNQKQNQNQLLYSRSRVSSKIINNSNLFTYNEIIDIVSEIVDEFTQCNTKADQIKVIAKITMKYLSHDK